MEARALGPRTKMIFRGLLAVLFVSLSLPTLKLFFTQDSVTRTMDPDTFPAVTVASVNCNSLNMSSVGSFNHKLKLYGITSLKSDIIMLSDIRLSNNANVSCIDSVKTTFRTVRHSPSPLLLYTAWPQSSPTRIAD